MHATADQSDANGPRSDGIFARRGTAGAIVVGLLAIHAGLLAYSAYKHSPTWDEYGHLVAGISHWEFGRFDLYRVNPPLVRTIAAIPVMFSDYEMDWSRYYVTDGERPERWLRDDFIRLNGARVFWPTTLARWACIPFSLIGGWACYLFASKLYGPRSGLIATTLWCFCPNILGHGQLITPDVAAAAMGVAAHYVFWRYLSQPSMNRAIGSGVLLGLALLTKTTWIILPPIWVAFWLARRVGIAHQRTHGNKTTPEKASTSPNVVGRAHHTPRWRELLLLALTSWYVLNLGYLFEGTFTPLGEYRFISRTFGGPLLIGAEEEHQIYPRNPHAESWLATIPIPLPKNLVQGIDIQKWDFERKMWSYLRGEWRLGGWWYYYLYAMAIKVPLAIWAMAALAIGMRAKGVGSLFSRRRPVPAVQQSAARREKRLPTPWRPSLDELLLLAPAIAVLVLVSSQTGFNHHMRYVIPALPFLFIWISQAARRSGELRDERQEPQKSRESMDKSQEPDKVLSGSRLLTLVSRLSLHSALVLALLAWFLASSLYYYPHGISYFNEMIGGPTQGWRHLVNSNTDWGQDLLYLKDWSDKRPKARPLTVAYDIPYVPVSLAGIDATQPPFGPQSKWKAPEDRGPQPGWHVLSVNQIHHRHGRYAYFQFFHPVDRIGYSMNVYHITLEGANRLRRRLGLPELAP